MPRDAMPVVPYLIGNERFDRLGNAGSLRGAQGGPMRIACSRLQLANPYPYLPTVQGSNLGVEAGSMANYF
jgi:hypothetical protein